MNLSFLTWIHTILSLLALAAGIIVAMGMLQSRVSRLWTVVFLLTSILTSVTGFLFPFQRFGDSHWVGVLSLGALAAALVAYYAFRLSGSWRWVYVIGALLAFYFNAFVAIAQLFKKVPPLHALAPTLQEPPFLVAQGLLLAVFGYLIFAAARRFRPGDF
jgi:hypothetical protein